MTIHASLSHLGAIETAARDLSQARPYEKGPPRPVPIWANLESMPRWLERARSRCADPEPDFAGAADWLLDNDYFVRRAIRQLREDMPPRFYSRLARMADPGANRLPRVFAVAHSLLDASHLQLSFAGAVQFVSAYQETAPLSIAELWAFPAMLRLACLELIAAGFGKLVPGLEPPFAVSAEASALQAYDPTECISRSLANLKVIDGIRWKDFFDRTSLVEAVLAGDPAEVYPRMDFDTRDRYRRAVEELAETARLAEPQVAERIVTLAERAAPSGHEDHVGHWLLGEGRCTTEAELGCRVGMVAKLHRFVVRRAGWLYAAALALISLAALAVPAAYLWMSEAGPLAWIAGVAVALVPATILGTTIVHWLVPLIVEPQVLPKLDFDDGIPADCRTVVAIPAILGRAEAATAFAEQLEMHWLANPDPALRFVLLSDLDDAKDERLPGDDLIEGALVNAVRELNRRHGGEGETGPFVLLHRARRFNEADRCWMGWERKRGKLEQFNHLILEGDLSAFPVREGDVDALRGSRFVITLDADTALPAGTAAKLVGTLAHPLNRAVFHQGSRRLRSGFAVVQPRIEILPEVSGRSPYTRLYAGDTAIDIYSRAVSDLYQDLFGSGIYVGKGIYDVEAFDLCLSGRVPENALISHDLFEGLHARAALASDIVLYESFPSSHMELMSRWHRWVRGDWQLLPWLGSKVPGPDGKRLDSVFSTLDRWKILDNLRRSLIPPTLLLFAVAGWLVLPGSAWVWTVLVVAAPGTYLLVDLTADLARGFKRGALRNLAHRLAGRSGRWFLAVVFLLSDTMVSLNAISRTLWRSFLSHRNMLRWTSSAQLATRFEGGGSRMDAWREMWPSSILSIVLLLLVLTFSPSSLLPALPLLLVWALAPEIAFWTARGRRPRRASLDQGQRAFLNRVARRTWLYFETYAGPQDNWLPPDNIQEEPNPDVAHRISPTNIGLYLASALTACDFGFVGLNDLTARLRSSFDTVDRLKRYRGHILNWYDSRSLQPLEPRYVSMVDSGNLAVCLVALRQGLIEASEGPALTAAMWDGLAVTFELLASALKGSSGERMSAIAEQAEGIAAMIARARPAPAEWRRNLDALILEQWPQLEVRILEILDSPEAPPATQLAEIRIWLERASHHLTSMRRDMDMLAPWLPMLAAPPDDGMPIAAELVQLLAADGSLADAEARFAAARILVAETALAEQQSGGAREWLTEIGTAIARGSGAQFELRDALRDLAARADQMAFAMDFGFLYDRDARLFYIGYNISSDRLDPHHYDLLATEARLASYFAIAKRDVPTEHWFFLGRPVTRLAGMPAILSWNGSMFEYLMPPLFLRSSETMLLGQSESAAVEVQRRYARQLGVPWGISESAYATTDAEHHYQYRAFGVPGLGLRRGLSRDLVVAPYASALALSARPVEAVANLERIERLGATGHYGFFEAIDFVPEHVSAGKRFAPVKAYMAHHQGMTLAAIGNALNDGALVRRFHADPRMRAHELLLQERIPWESPREWGRAEEEREPVPERVRVAPLGSWRPSPTATAPQMHLLGNGRLATWISDSGAGGIWWRQAALTRWRPDPTRDNHGLWIYVRDAESGHVWSASRQPAGGMPQDHSVVYRQHMVEMHRRDNGIGIRTEIAVAPFDDVDMRRITVVNETDRPRTLDITSFGEVVLAPPLEDERHPAFSKMFVGSAFVRTHNGLLFSRRPRQPEDSPPTLLHCLVGDNEDIKLTGYETDRMAFVGRNGDMARPRGIGEELTETTGFTLDPVMALQTRLRLRPRERRQFAFLTIAGSSRTSVLQTAERYATLPSLDWALADAEQEAAREARRLGLEGESLPRLQALCSLLTQPHPALREVPAGLASNMPGQPRLWSFGISGDLPILLLRVDSDHGNGLLETLVRAHRLWHRRGLYVDLVVLRTGVSGYQEPMREALLSLLREVGAHDILGRRGGIHLLFADQVGEDDKHLLEFVARVVLSDAEESLSHALAKVLDERAAAPRFAASQPPWPPDAFAPLERPRDLLYDNGLGGFSSDGREYVIHLSAGQHTPAPWCNILANDGFGSIVTEAGGGFTWAVNSGEHRLTPWANDPVADTPGEVLYLRDEATAEVWTPTPSPAGGGAACQIRHGAGYSTWLQRSHGLEQELTAFVPVDDPVKVVRLRLRNLTGADRRITATYYAEWLLGALGSVSKPYVVSEYDASNHALLATNPWNPEFAGRIAFLTASRAPHSLTANRRDFLGREGSPANPEGLWRWDLGGAVTPGADACAAYQVHLDLAAGGVQEMVFVLGEGGDRSEAELLVERWRQEDHAADALERVQSHWDDLLGAVVVKTPDRGFDLMASRWLLYQAVASRVMARAGYYQAGGAFGFRDQLQDVLALLHVDPARVRRQILVAAARQFEEGDVQHWWHPPLGRGVRTRCSDDFLWLPFVTARYIEATGDSAIFDEQVPFLTAPPLRPDEDDRYGLFDAGETRSLFEHCVRAIERGMTWGAHGLPLIGSGDWNDGMNRVGADGRGESVWLAWFEIAVMKAFAPLARKYGRGDLADRWKARTRELTAAVEQKAWDGAWYVRAFDDEGAPWGSKTSDECKIDSLAQSWAVLSSAGRPDRVRQAMQSATEHLVRDDERIVRLLWPPFHDTPRDPGYIKAYPPGIRENGGQYTHAAAWFGLAMARLRDGDGAYRVFDIVNPIKHAEALEDAEHYLREPYVIAADVGGVAPHVGRGGWSWYTGAAGWCWRLAVEGIIGLSFSKGAVGINPALPKEWGWAEVEVRGPKGKLDIRIEDPDHIGSGDLEVTVDGKPVKGALVRLPARGATRKVVVRLRRPAAAQADAGRQA